MNVNGSLLLFPGSLAKDAHCCRKTLEESVSHNRGPLKPGSSLQITANAAALSLPENHGPVTKGALLRKHFFFSTGSTESSGEKESGAHNKDCVTRL